MNYISCSQRVRKQEEPAIISGAAVISGMGDKGEVKVNSAVGYDAHMAPKDQVRTS